ncbi:MAG TPA: substrate-binding domain-containing protein [Bacteroidales bacterium]|nr:substrate-binding domain-containing protein [Bacteroidales bacterium]
MIRQKLFTKGVLAVLILVVSGCNIPGNERRQTGQAVEATFPENRNLILATTTSTHDTGLLDTLIPMFERKTGYIVKTISVGTGAALALGERGEADVLLVHAPASEMELVESGHAINRTLIMYNDFIFAGPASDPAGISGMVSPVDILKRISARRARFISRGDDSGTHKKEMSLWDKAGIAPQGAWYIETGSGMGQTLLIASERQGYVLTDRGTFLAHKPNLALEKLAEGDASLLNIYHILQVNPEMFSKVNADGAKAFTEFLLSPEAQKALSIFGVDRFGEPLFFPAAGRSVKELGQ